MGEGVRGKLAVGASRLWHPARNAKSITLRSTGSITRKT
jgi:hypothetical protein